MWIDLFGSTEEEDFAALEEVALDDVGVIIFGAFAELALVAALLRTEEEVALVRAAGSGSGSGSAGE